MAVCRRNFLQIAFVQRDFPVGGIYAWYGSVESIPGTFRLCDGTLNTPDLRDRFIRGASVGSPPGSRAGLLQHLHPFTTDTHFHAMQAGGDINMAAGLDSNTSFNSETGTSDNGVSLPPYHSLCYVMYAGRLH